MTADELLSDPVFVICAPIGVIVILLVIYFVFGGDTDIF
ncbi:hypothetical protein SEA_MARKY_4 [Streptomyces phage Marky]|nr:hypothetical protein SEA_MARKY_4 [Streptomyces phage Marky]